MSTLTLHAPAKTNLSLRILGRRDDGFHELDSLMVKLPGLADRIHFDDAETFSFSCNDPSLPASDDNLVVRAARAYAQTAGVDLRHRITLEKSVPHGAGLGGGSSDAATTLLGLNQLHLGALDTGTLHAIAANLGSDIPFFLTPGAARVTGRGEHITPTGPVPELPLLLLKPAFSVATPDAYRRWKSAEPLSGVPYSAQKLGDLTLINDLELPVFGKHRFLAELKCWLLDRPECLAAMLCGSGATVMAVLADGVDGELLGNAARSQLDPNLWHWAGTSGA